MQLFLGVFLIHEVSLNIAVGNQHTLGQRHQRRLVSYTLGGIDPLVNLLCQRQAAEIIGRLQNVGHLVAGDIDDVRAVYSLAVRQAPPGRLVKVQAFRRGGGFHIQFRHNPVWFNQRNAFIGTAAHAVNVKRFGVVNAVNHRKCQRTAENLVIAGKVAGNVRNIIFALRNLFDFNQQVLILKLDILIQADFVTRADGVFTGNAAGVVDNPVLSQQGAGLIADKSLLGKMRKDNVIGIVADAENVFQAAAHTGRIHGVAFGVYRFHVLRRALKRPRQQFLTVNLVQVQFVVNIFPAFGLVLIGNLFGNGFFNPVVHKFKH